MVFKLTNLKSAHRGGFTLPELVVGAGVAVLVLAGAVAFYLFSVRSFAAMSNYADLNAKSRNASDVLSRDIRCATAVTGYSSNQIALSGVNVTYTYSPGMRTLTRAQQGHAAQVLLTQVDSLAFSIYQRPDPNSPYEIYPAATAGSAKLVAYQWACSRQVGDWPSDSQGLQAAIVDLRNE